MRGAAVFLALLLCVSLAACAEPAEEEVVYFREALPQRTTLPAIGPPAPPDMMEGALLDLKEVADNADQTVRLAIVDEKKAYKPGEPIETKAVLLYSGEQDALSISHALPLVNFMVRGETIPPCEPIWMMVGMKTSLVRDEEQAFPFYMSYMQAKGDPASAFFEEAYQRDELRLPVGEYELIAIASYEDASGVVSLQVATRITVA